MLQGRPIEAQCKQRAGLRLRGREAEWGFQEGLQRRLLAVGQQVQ